jgi:1A family penicillin-binding protein
MALFLLSAFAGGFYLAGVYAEISTLIEQRRAALTSAIYSAPLEVYPGDEIAAVHLLDRLAALSYSRVQNPSEPGEYSMVPGAMTIYARAFNIGTRHYPAAPIRLAFEDGRVTGIADAFGIAMPRAMIEPEIIGRLLPDAPAERVEVSLNEVKPYLVKGLLATEDCYFYYHPGFDPIRIIEAAIIDVHSRRLSQGASTITQQLARTFIEQRGRSFRRKFRELAVALVLEIRFSKDEILERYINDVPMGQYDGTPIYGLPLAARYFFNKDLRELTPAETATLIGMIQAPTLYDPRRHEEAARSRRGTVLSVMRRAGAVDEVQYQTAMAQPVETVKAPGIRRAPYFTDYVSAQVSKLLAGGSLAGLRVYTTLNPELEQIARDVVVENLRQLEKSHPGLRRRRSDRALQGSLIAIDPRTGAVVAMVGGRDYGVSQFNRAANAQRQPGSAFKPIVYLAALNPAMSPLSQPVTLSSTLPDRPMSFGGWVPANYEGTYQGKVTVAEALARSLNVPTAYLGSLLGPAAIIRTAHQMGIHEKLPNYLPVSIGAGDTTLLELTSAYGVFADGGIAREPFAVTALVDAQGHLLYEHRAVQQRLMSRAIAYLMTGALQGVLRYGTGASAARMNLDFPAAGKTGTTEDYRDAYFVGYTQHLACGVWVGFDEPQTIGLTGAQAALPAWVHFMIDAVRRPQLGFGPPPPGITMVSVDPATGYIATPACPRVAKLPFLEGTEPVRSCPVHGGALTTTAAAEGSAESSIDGAPSAGASPEAAPTSSRTATATNGLFGTLGNFLGSLFGNH